MENCSERAPPLCDLPPARGRRLPAVPALPRRLLAAASVRPNRRAPIGRRRLPSGRSLCAARRLGGKVREGGGEAKSGKNKNKKAQTMQEGSDLPAPGEGPPRALPLLGVPPRVLRGHPGLQRLLHGLGQRLGPDGLSKSLEGQLQEARAGLELSRGLWLRWESLWRGVQELLLHPQILTPPVLQALEQGLALAQLRRGDPPFPLPLPPPGDPSPLGALVLPALERRLAQKTGELAQFHSGGEGGPPSSPPLSLPGALRAQRGRLGGARRQHRHLRGVLTRQGGACPRVLGRCRRLLEQLSGRRCAGERAALDRRRSLYLDTKSGALLLKIRSQELAVLLDTYTPEKIATHRLVRDGLEGAYAAARAEASGAREALAAFEGLGAPFGEKVREYGQLRERLRRRRWDLQQLRPQSSQ
ncbi:HAUS augmin-like complex subunit 4 [Athene noctua]|uniref:HAUS augmin-like complex subunit 4 n=1 Tax=Athene noctua TaxID=126797 RepID=UPI003EBB039C